MSIANELFKLVANQLSDDNKIAISALQEKAEEENYDWQQYGIDNFKDFLEEQDELTLKTEADGIEYVIHTSFINPRLNQAKTVQKIYEVMELMPKDNEGYVTTTALKARLEQQDIKWGSGTLGAFVKKMTDIFDTTQEGTIVRVRVKGAQSNEPKPLSKGPQTATPAPSSKLVADPKKRFVSIYELGDFACFDDYNARLRELGQMAREDGWFIITEEYEQKPLRLVNQKLKNNFALSIRQEMQEHGTGGIVLFPERAIWDTGFRTHDGHAILAHFRLNQYRDAACWQTWLFDHFSVEEGGLA